PSRVCFALMRLSSPAAGLTAAFATSVALCVAHYRRGHAVKILEIGTFILFGTLAAYTWLTATAWTVATVRLVVDSGLLAIAVVSLAIDRPFTLQYAREQVPDVLWALPIFLPPHPILTP